MQTCAIFIISLFFHDSKKCLIYISYVSLAVEPSPKSEFAHPLHSKHTNQGQAGGRKKQVAKPRGRSDCLIPGLKGNSSAGGCRGCEVSAQFFGRSRVSVPQAPGPTVTMPQQEGHYVCFEI